MSKRKGEGSYGAPNGDPSQHGYYISYEIVLEQPALALKAGDRLKFSVLVMPYGGKTSSNEIASALDSYNYYAIPQLVATPDGLPLPHDNPWLPTVKTTNDSTAQLTVRGGREMLTISAEGFSSYKPPKLYFLGTGSAVQIPYSVNGADGVTTYLDAQGKVGFSVPVDVFGTNMTFQFVQDPAPNYTFDESTLQSWTDLTLANSNTGPRNWAPCPPAFPGVTQNGSGAVGQNIVGGTQDSSHSTLWMRSPRSKLNGSGSLTVWLRGGTGSTGTPPVNQSAVPANSTSPGFQGIALRKVSNGAFVLTGRKTSAGDDWQQVTFSPAQLAALDTNAVYTLELIDAGRGGWGWVAMDSVSIPGTLVTTTSTPPVISAIADLAVSENTIAGPVPFTVGDAETAAA